MVFSSHVFVFYFLPLALLICFALAKAPVRARNGALVLLGTVFYGWADPRFLILMFATTGLDWMMSLIIALDDWRVWRLMKREIHALPPIKEAGRSQLQRRAIVFSVVSNLAVLGFFKYFNFATDAYVGILQMMGASESGAHNFLRIALPLGISFYTFQSLSYTIDVYRGDARAMRNFIDFSCFVSMFPHLVAGPILKFSFLADQLEGRVLTLDKCARGVAFFCMGMAKKIILANACAGVADAAFNAGSRDWGQAWLGAIAYAFQIYFDFSGYSDMAIGLGLMLGFVFARNFDHPYRAVSITDFWRRWHISLSTWLREYLYIPLGGNRKGEARTYFNLFITMLLGGLWHGAAWNYIVWGALHGGALALERLWKPKNHAHWFWKSLAIMRTFAIVLLAWVFFRAADLPHALDYIGSMLSFNPTNQMLDALMLQPLAIVTLVAAAICVWCLPDTWEWTQNLTWPKTLACAAVFLVSLALLATQTYNPFIYFIF